MPALRLWNAPGACSFAAHALLLEADLEFDLATIRVRPRFPTEYLKVNPKGKVPILELEDGTKVTETVAIFTLIAQKRPERHLMGRPGMENVRCYEWLNYMSGQVHGNGFRACFSPAKFSADESTHDSIRAKGKRTVLECFKIIESALGSPFAVGDSLTAVDFYLYVLYQWAKKMLKIDVETQYPRYTNLVLALEKLSSIQGALEQEGNPYA